jgi:hypothetical protein
MPEGNGGRLSSGLAPEQETNAVPDDDGHRPPLDPPLRLDN